ncbi:MAG: hypothetical protein R3Y26_02360 [Rikenellaceae bacterium]
MSINTNKTEPLFNLIKSLTKSEKRNFKLYVLRQNANTDAMFVSLFDVIDSMNEYDEAKIFKKCLIKKSQLPNMKAHLYRQILVSVRLLNVHHNPSMLLREQIDFAKILYDKGLYKQSLKILDKAKKIALSNEQLTLSLEIVEFEKNIETLNITRSGVNKAEQLSVLTTELCQKIDNSNQLSNISIQLYSLHLKLGYARSDRDLALIKQFFQPKLDKYDFEKLGFVEKLNFYQAKMWYAYIIHDFVLCFKYSQKTIRLFDNEKDLRTLYYDQFLKAYSRYLETLFLTKNYKRLVQMLKYYEEHLIDEVKVISDHAIILSSITYYFNRINMHVMEGTFEQAISLVPQIEEFLYKYDSHIDNHHKMMFYYKIACIYFGANDNKNTIKYTQKIIANKDTNVRRDLQCFARILNLIASYEAGIDYNMEYQIKTVYAFIMKMNDMHGVQKEMIKFFKRLNYIYASDFRNELISLYERIKPYENHPYERRPFFYLDIISWLESKIQYKTVQEIIQDKFKKQYGTIIR